MGVVQKGLRPVTPEGCNLGLLRLMQMCWDSYPAARPDFEQVLQIVPTIADEQLPEPMSTQSSAGGASQAMGGKDQKQGFFARMRRRVAGEEKGRCCQSAWPAVALAALCAETAG